MVDEESVFETGPLEPGDELAVARTTFRNGSGASIMIRGLSVAIDQGSEFGRIESVFLAHLSRPTTAPPATYLTFPPVFDKDGTCVTLSLDAPRDFEVGAGETAVMIIRVEALKPGRFLIGPQVIHYQQGGAPYRQTDLQSVGVRVETDTARLDFFPGEVACARELGSELLVPTSPP